MLRLAVYITFLFSYIAVIVLVNLKLSMHRKAKCLFYYTFYPYANVM